MRLQILQVPGCPGAELLDRRLGSLLQHRPDIEVVRQIVTTERDAKRLGMTGSPTILVDGTDLLAGPARPPSLSCRLYRDEQGRVGPAPTSAQLRQAIA
jgi:hypothetical protein